MQKYRILQINTNLSISKIMKNVLYAFLFLLTTSLIVISCTEEQIPNEKTLNQLNQIPINDYGFYHNEGLILYYKSQNGTKETNADLIIDKIASELQTKYPQNFDKTNLSEIKTAFKDINPQNFDIVTFWNNNKEKLYTTQKLSPKIGTLVDQIIEKNMSYNQYMHEIQTLKEGNTLSIQEQNSLIVFENVLKSSNEYWNSLGNFTNKTNKPGSKAILADGMGALMFVYSGPMSIIAGCACSLFVNEALE